VQDHRDVGCHRRTAGEALAGVEYEAQTTVLHVGRQPTGKRHADLPVRPARWGFGDNAALEELEASQLGAVERGAPGLELVLCRG
jgi:hypothetical protein